MMTPITKFAAGVMSTERVADMISMAARECFSGAYGPSYLEIPRDVLDKEIPVETATVPKPGHYRASVKSIGDPDDIKKLGDILMNSKSPAMLVGSQVFMSRGHQAAIDLARSLNIALYMNGASRGILPPGDPHYFNRTRSSAFKKADVIVIVGTPFDFRMGYGKRISNDATLIHIDQDYRTVGKNRDISIGLAGDPGAILDAVHKEVASNKKNGSEYRKSWLDELRSEEIERTEKLMPMFKSEESPIHPYRLAWEINEFLTEETIYIGDGGDIVTISAQAVQPRSPGNWMDPGALGSLGVGTGFAMAAGLANPDKEVVCLYGDGSFGMTVFDMETANRFGAPYIAIVGNNSHMNQIRYGQITKYGEERGNIGNKLGDVPFSGFAEMLGGYGAEIREPQKIQPALQKARESVKSTGKSAVINVWVNPDEYAPGTKAQTMYK
jgi:acetolactate synthase-1/2/3 large subunit